jgi:hypothetical protein
MSDPVEDAMLAKIGSAPQQTTEPDAVEEHMLRAIAAARNPATKTENSSGTVMSPEAGALDAAGGLAQTALNSGLSTAGALGGGLAEVGGLLTLSTDRAQRWHDWAQRNISTVAGLYDPTPVTETGKGIQNALDAVGEKVKKYAGLAGQSTLDATGSPALATAVDTGAQALAQIATGVIGARGAGLFGGRIPRSAGALESTLDQGRGAESVAVPAQGLERQVAGGGSAAASGNPYPTLTGQQSVRNGAFPQIKEAQIGGDVPAPERAVRSAIVGKILADSGEDASRVRESSVTGNIDTARTEHELSRAANPTPEGLILRDKIASEQRALPQFAENVINKTGASRTLIDDGMRGDLLNSTLYGPESLRAYLADQKNQIYAEAAQRQGPNPVQLASLEKMVSSPQLSSSLKIAGQPNFLPGVAELLNQFKTNGFENSVTGEAIAPNTVGAAMELHKALNSAWTRDNAQYIGRMKQAILGDVAQAGGADLYQRGNAIHAAERTLLDAPGMKKIFGDVNPNTGISEGLSAEKIPKAVTNLPFDQYSHVSNVFQDMANGKVPGAPDLTLPPELQQAGAQSLREMAGFLARDVRNAGGKEEWNPNSVNDVLNAHSKKLELVADPEVVRDLHTLNLGGYMMKKTRSYEGASQQTRRLDQAGLLEQHLPKIGGVVGGAVTAATGIPGAEFAGGMGGMKLQQNMAAQRQLKLANERDAQMEAAAKTGTKLRDLMK